MCRPGGLGAGAVRGAADVRAAGGGGAAPARVHAGRGGRGGAGAGALGARARRRLAAAGAGAAAARLAARRRAHRQPVLPVPPVRAQVTATILNYTGKEPKHLSACLEPQTQDGTTL